MLAQVDVLTLHIPLSPDTADLIDGRRLGLMRREAILLNLSRGGIVDETALHAALEGGDRGCGQRCLRGGTARQDHPLLSLGNFVATPHVGAATSRIDGAHGNGCRGRRGGGPLRRDAEAPGGMINERFVCFL